MDYFVSLAGTEGIRVVKLRRGVGGTFLSVQEKMYVATMVTYSVSST